MSVYEWTSDAIYKPKSEGGSSIFKYELKVDVLSQSIANNTSSVQLTLYLTTTTGTNEQWDTVESKAPTSSITVDGTVYPIIGHRPR